MSEGGEILLVAMKENLPVLRLHRVGLDWCTSEISQTTLHITILHILIGSEHFGPCLLYEDRPYVVGLLGGGSYLYEVMFLEPTLLIIHHHRHHIINHNRSPNASHIDKNMIHTLLVELLVTE
jgi:hypothetical protein